MDPDPDPEVAARPRVGHIQFLNCLPLYWGLVRSGALAAVELHKDTPDRLSEALVRGDLDIGPISVVEYLRHADELLVLPDLAVGADGEVRSVVLVSTKPVEDLGAARIALGATSRTSVLLARMLLEDRLGLAQPTYAVMPPDVTTMLLEADAAVLIGDVALRARYAAPARGLHVLDLAAAWREWTALPMVFALWCARRSYAASSLSQAQAVHAAFRASLDLALAHVDVVTAEAARYESELDAAVLAAYFRTLDFRLGPRQLEGLRAFADRAAARGAVPPLDGLRFLPG